MIKTLLIAGLLSTTALANTASADVSHCGVNETRFNPTSLSEYQECWLDAYRGDDTSGVLGSVFWVNINDKYYSAAISTLRWDLGEAFKQMIVDDQVSMAQMGAIDAAIEDLRDRISTADELRSVMMEQAETADELRSIIEQHEMVIEALEAEIAMLKELKDAPEYTKADLDAEYERGHKDGFAAGVASVDITSDNEAARSEGFAAGVASVDITSDNEAVRMAAYEAGETAGFAAGVASVTFLQSSYDDGFAAGAASIDITSDNEAVRDAAYADGVASVTFLQSSYDDGFAAGAASIDTTAFYNNGYAAGEAAAKADPMWNNEDGFTAATQAAAVAAVDTSHDITLNGVTKTVTADQSFTLSDFNITLGGGSSSHDITLNGVTKTVSADETFSLSDFNIVAQDAYTATTEAAAVAAAVAAKEAELKADPMWNNEDGYTLATQNAAVAAVDTSHVVTINSMTQTVTADTTFTAADFGISVGNITNNYLTAAQAVGDAAINVAVFGTTLDISDTIESAIGNHSDESDQWKDGYVVGYGEGYAAGVGGEVEFL